MQDFLIKYEYEGRNLIVKVRAFNKEEALNKFKKLPIPSNLFKIINIQEVE